ncbi:uncharacterized protein LOC133832340 [Humulus lupulus]|uniref:uncharacterized protein LOC133832340 n=1 Tax=Humulus lupulus TaxID=3486 RepID=UPI002B40E875|nr:uncharacterized protein LOC133832340 [Humulus lupulus]
MEEIGERHPNGQPWCIMSDRQKGLIEVVSHVPDNHHRYCCFHIENNMVKEYGTSDLKNMFWAAAGIGNFQTFQRIMDQIKEFNKDAYKWVTDIDAKHWPMSCFDTTSKVENMTNNHVESFNDWIDEIRFKPPIEMLEGLRIQNADMMCSRRVTSERWNEKLTPKVHLKVKQLLRRARYAQVRRVGPNEFQVDYMSKRCAMRLDAGWCICGQWQIRGIPRVHATACINHIKANINDYCSAYFTTEMWRKTYEPVIHPIPDESMWIRHDVEPLLPPPIINQPGRPKKHCR